MSNQKVSFKTEEELKKTILQKKAMGTPDLEIGQKYGVTFRYIERLITNSHGVNISAFKSYEPKLSVGDARNLSLLQDNSIDLICAHPPYANIIHYTDYKEGDLS